MTSPPGADLSQPTGHWRRWFDGEATWHEGSGMPASPKMAVVVIGFMTQPGLVQAVESLLGQDEEAEVVIVNSGGGDPGTLLAAFGDTLRIINIAQPLYVGAARNIGIDASQSPYVAFLAGDCRARPGWIAGRLKAHESGAAAVASAIVPDRGDAVALASHLCLFGPRSPEVPPAQALRYGASYKRSVFEAFGYFNPAMRTGEDTEFAKRLARRIHPAWDPAIQTEHTSPRHLPAFMADMFGRGRRSARHYRAGKEKRSLLGEVIADTRERTEAALRVGREILGLDDRLLAPIGRRIRLGSIARAFGLSVGRAAQRRARRSCDRSMALQNPASLAQATRAAEDAVRRDGETIAFRLRLAELLLTQPGRSREAEMHLDVAIWLSAFNARRLVSMADWLIERQLHDHAAILGDRACFCLPVAERDLPAIRQKLDELRLAAPPARPAARR